MIITPNTSIATLVGTDHLSVRAHNVLRKALIDTIGELLEMSDDEISRLRNCGRKTREELVRIKLKYVSLFQQAGLMVPDAQLSVGFDESIIIDNLEETLVTTMEEMESDEASPFKITIDLKKMIESPQAVATHMSEGNYEYVSQLNRLSMEQWVQCVPVWIEVMRRWLEHPQLGHTQREIVRNHAARVGEMWAQSSVLRSYFRLKPTMRKLWQARYSLLFASMTVRSKNVFGAYSSFEELLPYLVGMQRINLQELKNCGKKSFEEFMQFAKMAEAHFLDFASQLEQDDAQGRFERTARAEYLRGLYPFLNKDELEWLVDRTIENKPVSIFFLLYHYIERAESNQAKVYRMHYGLGEKEQPQSLVEISTALGLTRERVRQLATTELTLPVTLSGEALDVKSILNKPVIANYDPMWEENNLQGSALTPLQMMGICTALDGSYCIEQPSGRENIYLVKRSLLNNVRLMYTLNELERKVELRSIEPITVSVEQSLIQDRPRDIFDPDLMQLLPIIVDYFKNNKRVSCDEQGNLHIAPSILDVPRELEAILAERGSMMNANELYRVFNDKFPDKAITSMGSFRAQIYRSELIPVGRSGYYVLPSWEGIYTGTLVDYLEILLTDSEEPLSLDELTERARKVFPRTTSKSIASLISLDTNDRFVQLQDFNYGLTSRNYEAYGVRKRRIVKRFPFETRMEQLQEFVEQHEYFPLATSDEDEAALNRWMKNVEDDYITVDDGQRARFNEYMKQNELLPRSRHELNFRTKMRSLEQAVENHDDLSSSRFKPLMAWLKKELGRQDGWPPRCKGYYEHFLNVLRAHGLSLDEGKLSNNRELPFA